MLRKNPLYTAVAATLSVAALPAFAQNCADDDLAPDVFSSISRNNSLGTALATVPCAPSNEQTYKDGIGREFKVYTWSSPNKSLTVEMFENRVFKKSGQNLAYQSVLVRPDAPAYDAETGVMTIPLMNLTDDAGNVTTVYDAQIVMMANGEWSLSTYSTQQTGDYKYDPKGYPVSTFNLDSGKLYVPNLQDADGVKPFAAQLVKGGMWRDISPDSGAGRIPNYGHDVPRAAAPVFDKDKSVLSFPALTVVDENGNRSVVYDAKVLMDANGGWALLDYRALKEGESAPYDLTGYDMPLMDHQKGVLVATGIESEDGPYGIRAKLNTDGTWTHLAPSDKIPNVSENRQVADAPKFNEQSGLLELPALTLVDDAGKRLTVYDAKLVVGADGNWSLLDYKTLGPGEKVPYDLTGYVMPLLDSEKGHLVVLGAEKLVGSDEEGNPVYETLDIRASIKNDGTWVPVQDLLTPPAPVPLAESPQYNPQSGVLTMPALSLVDEAGRRTTVYDARVVVDAQGNWAVLDYRTLAADEKAPYDLSGYSMPLLDLKNGKLVVVGAEDPSGAGVDIKANLKGDGTWSPLTDSLAPVAPPPAAPAPSYNESSGVLTMPALSYVDEAGKRMTVYDAKVAVTADGNWAIIDYKTLETGEAAPYDLSGYELPFLDAKNGKLFVVGAENQDGDSVDIRANLNANGTWSQMVDSFAPPPAAPLATAPTFNDQTGILALPALSVVDSTGKRTTVYDARIEVAPDGNWAVIDYKTLKEGETSPYDLTGYAMPLLDQQIGRLVVIGAENQEGDSVDIRASLNSDGTWAPVTDAFAPAPTAPVASSPTFDTTTRVLDMPALNLVDESGKRTTVYDAKVMLTAEGKWALMDYVAPAEGQAAPYDLTGYTMPLLDESKGHLVVVGVSNSDGTTQDIRANLGSDSTWSPMLPISPTPSVDSSTGVMTIPTLTVISSGGQRSTIYDAKILLTDSGFWGLLDYQESANPLYETSGVEPSLLDYGTGNLMVVGLGSNGDNLLVKLNPDGTWVPLE